mgnify:CR=1 FL=1
MGNDRGRGMIEIIKPCDNGIRNLQRRFCTFYELLIRIVAFFIRFKTCRKNLEVFNILQSVAEVFEADGRPRRPVGTWIHEIAAAIGGAGLGSFGIYTAEIGDPWNGWPAETVFHLLADIIRHPFYAETDAFLFSKSFMLLCVREPFAIEAPVEKARDVEPFRQPWDDARRDTG